ncbi:hypothetical protein QBC46DRAFT_267860 [Diplogelasinospora grovesii]|uniref:Uncharacterized protein n=1 Tax=Diplogelasinospora grovesii TaxID=303347 RepID=A0AAN6N2A4_9PEZI|nr:hypothetical protein QBC46DRAFT_267860 [Diplogelasinospora grovesii]
MPPRRHGKPEPLFVKRCRVANSQPFLDEQPIVGSPDRSWSRFRLPLLRKCPFDAKIEFGDILGYGVDGAVWKVSIGGRPFALKVFWDNKVPEGTCYYAIQRECHNAALLQMIQSAVEESNEPIYLNPDPKTRQDAVANLHAFSDEGRRRQSFRDMPGSAQYTSTPRLRQCFGWIQVNERELFALPRRKRPPCHTVGNQVRALQQGEDYYAIVYEFVTERAAAALATAADIQHQLDFFWLVGFCFVPVMHTEEWHKFGLFIDMSDLVCPWSAGWSDRIYRRFVVGDDSIVNVDGIDSSDDDGGEGNDSSIIARVPSPGTGRHGLVEE